MKFVSCYHAHHIQLNGLVQTIHIYLSVCWIPFLFDLETCINILMMLTNRFFPFRGGINIALLCLPPTVYTLFLLFCYLSFLFFYTSITIVIIQVTDYDDGNDNDDCQQLATLVTMLFLKSYSQTFTFTYIYIYIYLYHTF